jgi:hypothetical protein
MAFASWIPASPGLGMPRYGIGLFTVDQMVPFVRQAGRPLKFFNANTGFDTQTNMLNNTYYGVHQNDIAGTATAASTGIIPVFGTSLASSDGTMTTATCAAGTNDAFWQTMVSNAAGGGGYKEVWFRLGYEANIPTVASGYNNGQAGWGAPWKAAFQHVSTVMRAKAATISGFTIRILFDTTVINALNHTSGQDNLLASYKPDPAYYDILSLDFYTGNFFPLTYKPWTGYSSVAPFTLNQTQGAAVASDVNRWATDFNPAAAVGGQGYTYDNVAHFLTFQDATDIAPNGGAGQSLYTMVQTAVADQRPIFHSECGGIAYANPGGAGAITQGNGYSYVSTDLIPALNSHYKAINDLNYYPYLKRIWAQIETQFGVPILGGIIWDQPSATNISGCDARSGNAHPGMRSTLQVLGYPLGQYGAVDPVLVVNDIPAALTTGTQATIRVDANYALTLSHLTVDFGAGAGAQALPPGAALIGTNSVSFSYTPNNAGNFKITARDTTLGYSSPPSDYAVTGSSTGTSTGSSAPNADYQALAALGKLICVAEFRPGSVTAGDVNFNLATLVAALQTQMPRAVFWQQYWDTNPSGAGWGMASTAGAAAALSSPWVLNRGEFAVNPVTGARTELLTITMSDGTVITQTVPAGTTITSQTLA